MLAALPLIALVLAWTSPVPAQAPAAAASAVPPVQPPSSAAPSTSTRGARSTVGCLIGPERVADIGTAVAGIVASVPVERGDIVRKGQPIVLLDSAVEAASVRAARERALIDADVLAAAANLELARQRHSRTVTLVDEGFVSALTVEQMRAEHEVAEQKLAQARGLKKVHRQELEVASAQLGQRTLRAPFTGVVVERHVNVAERVEDRPLLRLAQLDPLRVELVMPATRWGSVRKGEAMSVLPELPGARSVVARVTHIDTVLDAASNTFRVRLSLPNPGHELPAGARCKLDSPVAGDAPPSAARAGAPKA